MKIKNKQMCLGKSPCWSPPTPKPAGPSFHPTCWKTTEPCLFDKFRRDGFTGTLPEKKKQSLHCSSSLPVVVPQKQHEHLVLLWKVVIEKLVFEPAQIPVSLKSILNSTLLSSMNIPEKLECVQHVVLFREAWLPRGCRVGSLWRERCEGEICSCLDGNPWFYKCHIWCTGPQWECFPSCSLEKTPFPLFTS